MYLHAAEVCLLSPAPWIAACRTDLRAAKAEIARNEKLLRQAEDASRQADDRLTAEVATVHARMQAALREAEAEAARRYFLPWWWTCRSSFPMCGCVRLG